MQNTQMSTDNPTTANLLRLGHFFTISILIRDIAVETTTTAAPPASYTRHCNTNVSRYS